MFETLTQRINQAIQRIKGVDKITSHNISTSLKEIRRALVEADVPYKIAKEFIQEVKEKAIGQEVHLTISPGQLFTKIVQDQLTTMMGKESAPLALNGNPNIILLMGLQGAGKTTFAGKLARHLKRQNKSILLVGCDIHRPVAGEQLQALGQSAGIDVYTAPNEKDPMAIVREALQQAKATHKKTVIIDTAGRLASDEFMMQEIAQLKEKFQPQETLFVVDAMIGQTAIDTIKIFNEKVSFDGVVLTKMDSDTRGGVAIAVRKATEKPIKLISTGEKLDNLELFHPDRMAKRILGMTDITSFVERVEQAVDEQKARELSKKVRRNQLDFNDMKSQFQSLKNMGSLQSLTNMIPGLKGMQFDEGQLDDWEVMIDSMTPYERANPDVVKESRRERIIRGSGLSRAEVGRMLKQFDMMRKKMTQASKKGSMLFSNPFGRK